MKAFPARPLLPTRWVLPALLLLALALRLWNAATGSLILDDFHSLHHARAGGPAQFLDSVARDNHPPLSFLLLAGARALGGESPWVLRLPALLAGLATVLLVWNLGARLACPRGRAAATFLVACSALHVELSTELRMYALLGLCCAGLLDGLLRVLSEGRGALRVALWSAAGLHTHYHFLHALAALGGVALALVLFDPRHRARRAQLLGGLGLGGLLALPWYALVFPSQLAHGLAPGGSHATLLRLAEGLKNLVFWNVSVAGAPLRWIGLAASALFLLLLSGAALLALRARGATGLLLCAGALLAPLLGYAAAQVSGRAGFEWRYLIGALPAAALLVGSEGCATGLLAGARRHAVQFVCLVALLVALANARARSEEDYAGAVAAILAEARPGDAVLAADWQPDLFPHALAWEYYAARLAQGRSLPPRLEFRNDLSLVEPQAAAGHARVLCCLRSLPDQCALLRSLRQSFAREDVRIFGRSVFVHTFSRP